MAQQEASMHDTVNFRGKIYCYWNLLYINPLVETIIKWFWFKALKGTTYVW